MPTLWSIHLLGGLSAQRTGQEAIRFRVVKTSSLLAYLACRLDEGIAKEQLIETLWPDVDIASGRHSLSESISVLRRQLEPPDVEPRLVLKADHSCVRLDGRAATTDLARFKLTIDELSNSSDPAEQTSLLRRAAAIYSGELLPGFFDDWIIAERMRLSVSYLQVYHRLIAMLRSSGQCEEALEYALRATAISPDCEEVHEEALKLMIDLGRKSDAVHFFDAYRKRLMRSIGQLPGSSLCRIIEPFESQLNCSRPGRRNIRNPKGPDAAPVVQEHGPVHSDSTSRLPIPLTRFFGREEELARVSGLLSVSDGGRAEPMDLGPARLVTVTGLGGSGKTRFAIEAGRQLERQGSFGKQIAYVPLSGVTRAQDISQAIADALQLSAAGNSHSVSAQIRNEMCGKPWLLLLDNCEHIPEAGEVVQGLIEDLSDLRVLATSRMPLGVDGEHLFALQPLAAPLNVTTPTALYEFPSVQMFVNRAQAVSHDFQITERNAETICKIMRQLEGIPLAIELAAAHVITLTPSQILTALADRFDLLTSRKAKGARHRALRDTLEWSFELLSDEAQRFFVRLSIFRGGFTSDAARAVCRFKDTRGLLQDLAERSLIVPEPGREVMRFTMLESLREYAAERLTEEDRNELPDRHAAYYLQLAQEAAPLLRTVSRSTAVSVLDEARANLHAAVERTSGTPDELKFSAALWQYWEMRGYIEPGLRLMERALQRDAKNREEYAETLHGSGVFHELMGDLRGAELALRQSLALSEGCASQSARVRISLAVLLDKRGEHRAARVFSLEALALLRNCDLRWDMASCLNTLGRQHRFDGALLEAESYFTEAQSLLESFEDWPSAAAALHNLGCIAYDLGNFGRARSAFERGLALFRDLNRPQWIAYGLQCLGDTLGRQGELRAAQAMLLECLDLRNQLHDPSGIASTIEALAMIAHSDGDSLRAIRLVAGATALRNRLETPLAECDHVALQRDIDAFRSELSNGEFRAAWDFGIELSLERLVTYAREQRLISGDQEWETERVREREMIATGVRR